MNITKKLSKEIFLDFNGVVKKRTIKLKFSKKISKSVIYISKKTGSIFHSPTNNAQESLEAWSKKIYSKKIDTKEVKYTSNNPIMKSRHYYSAIFLNDMLKKGKINFCDYGTGEGNFGKELIKINKNIKFNFTEHSPALYSKTVKLIKKINKGIFYSHNGSIESSVNDKNFKNFDAASLLWTLCNCVKPVEVLGAIHSSLKCNGLLIISESSRILVPFKKPIHNFFVSSHHTQNTHPWYFSYNSLSNLLEICGFRIIKFNRYYDENDLVVIAQKKNKKSHNPKIKIDNYNMLNKFFKEWEKNSNFFKKFF
ncbi:methyltransferase domain-containing protein [Candidatus Pelagibacter sp. Uisw_134_02]|uniref:methyltransferase domain-containing protein n=1 Tax=Candidatus Pelagibacter sp. Uisw_134_02 TaxID=3230990 RepID=UPI0039EBD84F